jgi:hypothetical protein
MDLVTLIAACSLAASANTNTTLYQITQTVDAQVYYIDDMTDAAVYQPTTLEEAAGITRALVEAGHDVRVGLTQVPARASLQTYNLTPTQLLDPCTNIAIGSDRLSLARGRHGDAPREVLSWYLTGSTRDPVGISWANDVLAKPAVDIQQAATRPGTAPASPRFSAPDNRLFVDDADDSGGKPRRHPSASITPNTARTGESTPSPAKDLVPTKWEPPRQTQDSKAASSSSRSQASSESGTGKAQPDVTDERLPTSEDLEQTQGGRDE